MKYRIRQASVLDAQVVADHRASWFAARYAHVVGDEVARQALSAQARTRAATALASYIDAGGYVWVAVDEAAGWVAHAFAGVSDDPDAPTPLELVQFCVSAAVDDPGLSEALLTHALGDAPAFTWVVATDVAAQAFLTERGFRDDGGRRTDVVGTEEMRLVRA